MDLRQRENHNWETFPRVQKISDLEQTDVSTGIDDWTNNLYGVHNNPYDIQYQIEESNKEKCNVPSVSGIWLSYSGIKSKCISCNSATANLYTPYTAWLKIYDPIYDNLKKEFTDIIAKYPSDVDIYEEEDIFSRYMTEWIRNNKINAINIIKEYFDSRILNQEGFKSILMILGSINDYETYSERKNILVNFLNDPSPSVRYGAIIGLNNLNEYEVVNEIENRLKIEPIPTLRGTLKSVLKHLSKSEGAKYAI